MRCLQCDYSLWNLKARQCPECGTPVTPSAYEFVPNSVRFCCPHCEQPYYGTGATGLLEPDAFDCVRCGRHITLDEMVLAPAEGVADEQTKAASNPWLERNRTGGFKGWWATIVQSLVSPNRLAHGTPETSSLGQAWWFTIVTCAVTFGISLIPAMCIGLAFGLLMPRGQAGGPSAPLFAGMMALSMTFGIVFMFVFVLVFAGLWALLTHLLLRMSGSGHGPLRVTMQSILYSSGTMTVSAVPCVGKAAMVWWIVSAVLMVKESHGITGVRATFTVLAGPVVAMVLLIALYMGMIATAFMGAGGMAAAAPQVGTQATQKVLTGLVTYAAANGGRGPAHALELLMEPGLSEQDFIDPSTLTFPVNVPVAGMDLADLALMAADERPAVIEQAAAALPDRVVAHRVGDFVFTYHGAVLDGRAPGLWLVVMTPDPDTAGFAGSAMPVVVGRADDTTRLIPWARFTARFNQQNHLRAAQGLPPLPYPPTLTHESPAVADNKNPG